MALEDAIDYPTVLRKLPDDRRVGILARHIVYVQLFALIPSVLIGRCEEFGYGAFLETMGATGAVPLIAWSALLFPPVTFVIWARHPLQERRSWAAPPLSLAMSFAQLLAVLPSVS
jgi:hypothetical protein